MRGKRTVLGALVGFLLGLLGLLSPAAAQSVPATQCVATALAGGTANALTVPLLPCTQTTTLLVLTLSATNTGAATLQETGFAALPMQNVDGSALSSGELVSGNIALLTNTGTAWRLLGQSGYLAAPQVSNLTALQGSCVVTTSCTLTGGGGIFAAGTVVLRGTYGNGNAAPPQAYVAEIGTCAANGEVSDGGSCINTTSGDGNSFQAVPGPSGISLLQWGAIGGANADTAVSSAIAYACLSHVPIRVPLPAQPFQLAAAHIMGNGSTTQFSTCNGTMLRGDPPYPEDTSGTSPALYPQFKWTGSSGVIPFTLQGPAESLGLIGIAVNCNQICSTGFEINNTLDSEYGWLGVNNQVGPAFILTSTGATNTWGGGLENDWFHDLFATQPYTGGDGAIIGNVTCASSCTVGTIDDHFDGLHLLYDGQTIGTYGIKFGMATQSTFHHVQVQKVNGLGADGSAIVVAPPSGALGYPDDLVIDHIIADTDIDYAVSGWNPVAGGIHILDWSRVYASVPADCATPQSYGMCRVWGSDHEGNWFGNGPWNWTPADASGASPALTFSSVTATYMRTRHGCDVHLDVTYPTTASGADAAISGVPLLCQPHDTNSETAAGYTSGVTATPPIYLFLNNAGQINFYNNAGGVTNAGLTGARIAAEWTFGTTN